jgi:uncharacterized repeat protein (TIGR03803 family)
MKRLSAVGLLASCAVVFLVIIFGSGHAFAATEDILHYFNLTPSGQQPSGGLITDAAGNLYGTTVYGGTYGFGTVFKLTPNGSGGWTETVLYSFNGTSDGDGPTGSLLFDAAGNLYGGAIGGGSQQYGVIFKLTPHTGGAWTESVIWNFHGADGTNPNGGLIFDQAGNLYGTTTSGGGLGRQYCIDLGCGTAFRLAPGANGKWTLTTLYTFDGQSDGANPNSGLAIDKVGNLYGTTSEGGDRGTGEGYGVVFELTPSSSGWTQSVLHTFTGGADGGNPYGSVLLDQSGNLYGATSYGGTGTGCNVSLCGTVFELTPATGGQWTESVLYSFNSVDGSDPQGNLTFDQSGNLYGTTRFGGTASYGTVFELTHGSGGQWSESVLWNFTNGADDRFPTFGVTLGSSGQIYGAVSTLGSGAATENGIVFELQPGQGGTWQETTVTSFRGGNGHPLTGLVADGAGNFYGATNQGGANGYGGVYKLSPTAGGGYAIGILYNFTSGLANSPYGPYPSGLLFDSAGNLYGETGYGGAAAQGTVYELSPSAGGKWTEKNLYTFTGHADGGYPSGGLILDSAGNLYGTTEYGGSDSSTCRQRCGTVFKLTPSAGSWTESVLYEFTGGSIDGKNPVASLVFDGSGNLYGTTKNGGIVLTQECGAGCGTVFELSPSSGGWTEHILYFFGNTTHDGENPWANVIFDSAGNLYGTTVAGGKVTENYCGTGCGTVFKLSPSGSGWSETVLLSFSGTDGSTPLAPVVFDTAGNLYGTSQGFTGDTWGSVYELSPASGNTWNETVLHTFPIYSVGDTDGYFPSTGLILDFSGNLYGTTPGGGQTSLGGTVFEIVP